ncbi:MAG: hypothetical protein IJ599_02655 [Alphaproteobacteria bacterium]|nr:hypothetical protein [Alphaproteobacteria bacterium]
MIKNFTMKWFYKILISCLGLICYCHSMDLKQSMAMVTDTFIPHRIFGEKMKVIPHKADIKRFDMYLRNMNMNPNNPENVVKVLLRNCCKKDNKSIMHEMAMSEGESCREYIPQNEIKKYYTSIAKNPVGLNLLKIIAANGREISDNEYPLVDFWSTRESKFRRTFDVDEKNQWKSETDWHIEIYKGGSPF